MGQQPFSNMIQKDTILSLPSSHLEDLEGAEAEEGRGEARHHRAPMYRN